MRTRVIPAVALAALALGVHGANAQDFDWSGRIDQGRTIEVKGVNGEIRASAASGDQVTVTATLEEGRRGSADDIRFEVLEHGDGVTICAVYPTPDSSRRDNECAPGDDGRMNTRDNDVKVNFEVQVPTGVRFAGRTVNGRVSASSLSSDVEAYTVNGSIRVSAAGLVRASTVNGSVDVSMGRADWTDELEIETVNGGITIAFTDDLNAEVRASTVNGSISSDWPLTVRGRFSPKRLSGTVGDGGRTLTLGTVNGDIELRRR
jgi:hypothetical protein